MNRIIVRIVCNWRGHTWQNEILSPCENEMVCSRCGTKGEEILYHHDWREEVINDCESRMICSRCPAEGEEILYHHDWREEVINDCESRMICSRCPAEGEEILYHHDWYVKVITPCENRMACSRCDYYGGKIPNHKWGNWETSEYSDSERAEDLADPSVPTYGTLHAPKYSTSRQCERCGAVEYE